MTMTSQHFSPTFEPNNAYFIIYNNPKKPQDAHCANLIKLLIVSKLCEFLGKVFSVLIVKIHHIFIIF